MSEDLGHKTRRAIAWNAANAVMTNLLRIAVIAILGRLLAPADFGVVAAAMTVILLAGMLRDFGLGQALVQRKEVEPEHVEVAFTITVMQGVVIGAGIASLAGPLASFFGMEQSTSVIRALAILFVLRSLAIVPTGLLQRDMNFRAVSIADFAGYAVGSIASVVLAAAGFGPWSLVWGYTVETFLNMTLIMLAARTPWRFGWHTRHFRDLFGFGAGRTLAALGNYFATQGDYIVIGHALEKTQLGLYQRAYELVRFPANAFQSIAGTVLFSAISKVQDNPERMGRVVRRSTFACAVVLLPASAGLFVLAPEVIRILLGDQWNGAVWPFRVMVATMLFRTTYKLGVVVGLSSGRVFAIAVWQWIYAAVVLGGGALAVSYGILGVAITTSLGILVNFVGMCWLALSTTSLTTTDLVRAHAEPLGLMGVVGGATWVVAEILRALELSYVGVAAISTAVGSLVFLGFMAVGLRRTNGDWPWLRETVMTLVRRKRRKPAPEEPVENTHAMG